MKSPPSVPTNSRCHHEPFKRNQPRLFKSRVVLIVTLGVIVLLIVWWFAWMAPEANKLASVNQQVSMDQTRVNELTAELAALKAEKKLVLKELPYLKKVTTAIPPTEDPPGIVDSLNTLANQTSCDLLAVTPADTPSPSGTPGLSVISVSVSVSGIHGNLFSFLRRLLQDEAPDDDQQRLSLTVVVRRQHIGGRRRTAVHDDTDSRRVHDLRNAFNDRLRAVRAHGRAFLYPLMGMRSGVFFNPRWSIRNGFRITVLS